MKREFKDAEILFDELPGSGGLAVRAFISLAHPRIGEWVYHWLAWQKRFCPVIRPGESHIEHIIHAENTISRVAVSEGVMLWREMEAWSPDDWGVVRSSFMKERAKCSLMLADLWAVTRTYFRRSELVKVVEPVVLHYISTAVVHTHESVAGLRYSTNAAFEELVRQPPATVLFAQPMTPVMKENLTGNEAIRRDLALFLTFSLGKTLGTFARLPLNRLLALADPPEERILLEARTMSLLTVSDVATLHERVRNECANLSLGVLADLVPLAFPAATGGEDQGALLTCFAMNFTPEAFSSEDFLKAFEELRDYYNARQEAYASAATRK